MIMTSEGALILELKARTSKIKGKPGIVRVHEEDIESVDFNKGDKVEMGAPGNEGKKIVVRVFSDKYVTKGTALIREEDMSKLNISNRDPVVLRRHNIRGKKKGNKQSEKVFIKGNKLICPVCNHDQFWSRNTLLNTRGLTFLDWDWVNKNAQNYVCSNCGYMYWFHP